MAVIYTRGRALKTAFTALFVVVAGVSTGLAVWATRSQGLLRLLSDADPWAHQSRTRAVWGLLALVVLLVVGLKTGSPAGRPG